MAFLPRFIGRAVASTRNALELARFGRLGQPYGAPYEIIDVGPHHKLRAYATCQDASAPPILLVPPLMVTSEVYDIEADNSAVAALGRRGVRPFVVDFGAPEREAQGMQRTLDDHVLAVVDAIRRVREATGKPVHLAGYSQGGMFAYQAAAYVRSEGLASVITFGSPVDIHRGLPAVSSGAAGALLRFVEPVVTKSLERIEGLPGELTSTGFKLLSTRKEIEQRLDFLRLLHDRGALVRREARRRFLGGEGFVAWPGPAFRAFVDQFIVHNRMLSGGFVLSGRTATLADITCPILAFFGTRDELARSVTVKAISRAAHAAAVSFVPVSAGHFGIVVGSRAMDLTWPTVAEWVLHLEGRGAEPAALRKRPTSRSTHDDEPEGAGFTVDLDIDLFVDAAAAAVKDAWRRLGDLTESATDAVDGVRYQEPRLRKLSTMTAETRTSAGLALRERAKADPEETFFLYQGRAFTYRDADQRVDNVVRGLFACGLRPGDRVGVVMGSRPSFLSAVTAIVRLGAIAVVCPPDASADALRDGLASRGLRAIVSDPPRAETCRDLRVAEVLVLGGGRKPRALAGVTDMEAIDPDGVLLPEDLVLDAGCARDLAMILLRPTEDGRLRAAPVTNHRWALSALGAAAACTLKPEDTVYAPLPLHHPAGILVSVGAALVGGCRLALADRFDAASFLPEVRRYGATVVFYAGEMLRPLLFLPPSRGDHAHPIRLFSGSGMRPDLWDKLRERYGAGVMEFYASTTQHVIMANPSGEKIGALGRELPGSVETTLAKVDLRTRALVRDAAGRVVRPEPGELGVLLARVHDANEAATVEGAFEPDDRWFMTGDVVRADPQGDLWFVDALSGFVSTPAGAVSTRRIENALYTLPEIELAAAFESDGGGAVDAAVVCREAPSAERLAAVLDRLAPHERPRTIVRVPELPLTDGYRPDKSKARALARGAPPLV